jgi:hypothetical protein
MPQRSARSGDPQGCRTRSPPFRHQSYIISRVDVGKRHVCIPAVPRLLGISVVTGLEVMYDKAQLLLARRGDDDFVALLLQPLIGIHHLQRFSGVTG